MNRSRVWEILVVALPVVCAAECTARALVVALLPAVAGWAESETLERVLWGTSAAMCAFTLRRRGRAARHAIFGVALVTGLLAVALDEDRLMKASLAGIVLVQLVLLRERLACARGCCAPHVSSSGTSSAGSRALSADSIRPLSLARR
ncbi:MAG TPA: hypothetical protein VFF73_02255 [Planctomycetota bacterium]|nr:hypothetical protein [Planctomycetota bacterium]